LSAALSLYRAGTGLLEPLAPAILSARARRGKEDAARLGERLGRASAARPEGPLAWLHGASVGESLSLLPLVERLRADRPHLSVLVTSGTVTSAELLARRLPEGVIHQYAPVDAPRAAARFLDHWRPDVAVFVESELWPLLITGAKARGSKLALVSARIGEGSVAGWARAPDMVRAVLASFDLVLPQDDEAAARLAALGARDDGRLNLKLAGEAPPADEAALGAARAAIGERPMFLAASTHPGEEAVMLHAFAPWRECEPRPLLVIVPRHPVRGPEVLALAREAGFAAALRSKGEAPGEAVEVYVADTLGELGLWFRLARLAVMGGSFTEGVGGHNPLEAARLGCPVASGREVANWASVYAGLEARGGVTMAAGAEDLAKRFGQVLRVRDESHVEGARSLLAAHASALDEAMTKLEAFLP
jgi:3-deoxy-D-manno-octulosonic-acid transferase